MQGGQGPGRGIYVARRVVAALVVLLLLIMFVPWACQNLLGPGEQSGSETSETDDVDRGDDGGEEAARDQEVDTEKEAAEDEGGVTENGSGAERRDSVRASGVETDSQDDEADSSGEEEDGGGASNIELDTPGFVGGFEAVGGVEQIPLTLDLGLVNQQSAQPPAASAAAPVEPVFLGAPAAPAGPLVPAEAIIPAEAVVPIEPVFFGEPFLFEDPFVYEDRFLFEEPLLFDSAAFPEERAVFEEPVVLEEAVAQDAGPIAIASATEVVAVERRGDRGRGGNDRPNADRGGGDDGRDLGPR